jgi:hypothetical protein
MRRFAGATICRCDNLIARAALPGEERTKAESDRTGQFVSVA